MPDIQEYSMKWVFSNRDIRRRSQFCNIFPHPQVVPAAHLSDSKPCIKCVNELMSHPQMYGYKIDKIYYTDSKGDIICTKLTVLIHDTNQHVTKCYREKGYRGKYVSYDPIHGIHVKC